MKNNLKTENERNIFLTNLAIELSNNRERILLSNKKDLEKAKRNNLSSSFIERLKLDSFGLDEIIKRVESITNLESGIGEIIEKKVNNLGLEIHKVRVPVGTILIIYESRPEVTIDVVCLCIKSGNVAILKGGS